MSDPFRLDFGTKPEPSQRDEAEKQEIATRQRVLTELNSDAGSTTPHLLPQRLEGQSKPLHALVIVTSNAQLGELSTGVNGRQGGVHPVEALKPIAAATLSGVMVDVASPKGGAVPLDPIGMNDNSANPRLPIAHLTAGEKALGFDLLSHTIPLSQIKDPGKYDLILIAGGHAASFDLPKSDDVKRILGQVWQEKNPPLVGAICHGTYVLPEVIVDGKHIIAGKNVTGYPDSDDAAQDLLKFMPTSQESFGKAGAHYTKADKPFGAHVVTDNSGPVTLVTAQNPISADDWIKAISAAEDRMHPAAAKVGAAARVDVGEKVEAAAESARETEARNGAAEKATSEKQWTGIAVDKDGQKFVNYPRWSLDTTNSVGKLDTESGKVLPFPNEYWNSWKPGESGDGKFVCVQSVVVDAAKNHLWVLDPAHPDVEGMKGGTPKLVELDPATGKVLQKYPFPSDVAPDNSYLNDVRFDKDSKHAFLTDSNLGGIVVLDLETGKSRRLLANDPSTKSEEPADLTIDGKTWLKNGKVVPVQSDGIAVDTEHGDLYYHAMTSHSLYKVPIAALLDENNDDKALAKQVEFVMKTTAPDGMEYGPDGFLYLTDIENNAIKRWKPGTEKKLETVAQGPDLHWPDSMAFAPDGSLWFTTSQINLGPHPQQPYGAWRIDPGKLYKAKN